MLRVGFFVLFAMQFACAHSSAYNPSGRSIPRGVISPRDRVVIAIALDGASGNEQQQGSSLSVAQMIEGELARMIESIRIVPIDPFKDTPEGDSWDVAIVPRIVHWEQRATEWSGVPSKASIRLSVYRKSSPNPVDVRLFETSSGTFAMSRPDLTSMLQEPVSRYLNQIVER
jgi:hypothetical protein